VWSAFCWRSFREWHERHFGDAPANGGTSCGSASGLTRSEPNPEVTWCGQVLWEIRLKSSWQQVNRYGATNGVRTTSRTHAFSNKTAYRLLSLTVPRVAIPTAVSPLRAFTYSTDIRFWNIYVDVIYIITGEPTILPTLSLIVVSDFRMVNPSHRNAEVISRLLPLWIWLPSSANVAASVWCKELSTRP